MTKRKSQDKDAEVSVLPTGGCHQYSFAKPAQLPSPQFCPAALTHSFLWADWAQLGAYLLAS